MDSAPDHLVSEPPADERTTRSSAHQPDEDSDVKASKQRLVESARAVDPLQPLRRNPFVTVATAAVIGVVAASPAAARTVQKILPAILPSGIAARLLRSVMQQCITRYAKSSSTGETNEKSTTT